MGHMRTVGISARSNGNRPAGLPFITLLLIVLFPLSALAQADASAKLEQLFADAWAFELREDPLFATRVGVHTYDDQLPSVTAEDFERRLQKREAFLSRLQAISRRALSLDEQISYDIFQRLTEDEIAEARFKTYLMPVTHISGFHVEFPELPRHVPLETARDYEHYIARLQKFQRYAAQHVELMRAGIAERYTVPGVVFEDFDDTVKSHIVDDPAEHRLFRPFKEFPESIKNEDRQRLVESGKKAIMESVVPGYRAFLAFMQDEYIPACRQTISASALPEGEAFYAHRVRMFTTLDDSDPQQVHQTGQEEVERITREMKATIQEAGFEGGIKAYIEFLKGHDAFYAKSPEALLEHVAYILKQMDGKLPTLFGRFPRMPYGIREVPDYLAPQLSGAYYEQPAGDGTKAGFFYLNTYDLESQPLYEMEALSLHEAVPGHHFQIALQQEIEDLPPFRRYKGFTAFIEGWALYAERLGLKVGFYQKPASNFGRLNYEMWRALRLVVDTGLHSMGWSRERAVDFIMANSGMTRFTAETEVDRYLVWPGQALAYKAGELKIRELRDHARKALGERFDVRAFHDVVLGSGAVPLTILERQIDAYILERQGEGATIALKQPGR